MFHLVQQVASVAVKVRVFAWLHGYNIGKTNPILNLKVIVLGGFWLSSMIRLQSLLYSNVTFACNIIVLVMFHILITHICKDKFQKKKLTELSIVLKKLTKFRKLQKNPHSLENSKKRNLLNYCIFQKGHKTVKLFQKARNVKKWKI